MSDNKKYLVTGCAGFIGGHIVRRLIKQGCMVVGVDNFSTGKRENIADIAKDIEFIEGDLCDPEISRRAVAGVDCIFHQASIASVPRSLVDPLGSLHSSVTTTVTLLSAARDAGVRRFVQAASSSAYGDSVITPKTEDLLPHPLSPYAVAKLTQEYYAAAFSSSFGMDTVSLRYFNVYGPRQDPNGDYAAVIPKFISIILGGGQPVIFGDGGQTRDFAYVENVVDANLAAANCKEKLKGDVINIAGGIQVSLNDLLDELNKIMGTKVTARYAPPRAGDVRHSHADTGKAERLLGFAGKVSLAEGLRLTVEYFRGTVK